MEYNRGGRCGSRRQEKQYCRCDDEKDGPRAVFACSPQHPVGRVEHFYPKSVQCTRGQVAEIRVLECIWDTLRSINSFRSSLDSGTLMSKIAGMFPI
jgi:hypothetical protein